MILECWPLKQKSTENAGGLLETSVQHFVMDCHAELTCCYQRLFCDTLRPDRAPGLLQKLYAPPCSPWSAPIPVQGPASTQYYSPTLLGQPAHQSQTGSQHWRSRAKGPQVCCSRTSSSGPNVKPSKYKSSYRPSTSRFAPHRQGSEASLLQMPHCTERLAGPHLEDEFRDRADADTCRKREILLDP